jgi:hypothetical protein
MSAEGLERGRDTPQRERARFHPDLRAMSLPDRRTGLAEASMMLFVHGLTDVVGGKG